MIVGRVDRDYDVIIPIDFLERGSRLHRLEVPIDTGFDGYLMLPRRIVHQLGMTLERRVTMTLANEQDSVFERYLAEVLWFGRPLTIKVPGVGKSIAGWQIPARREPHRNRHDSRRGCNNYRTPAFLKTSSTAPGRGRGSPGRNQDPPRPGRSPAGRGVRPSASG